MKNPKLLHIVDCMGVGGLERQVHQIFLRLHNKYDMTLWCLYEDGYFADEIRRFGVDVRLLPQRNWYNPLNLLWMAQQMRMMKAQIIHSHGYNTSLLSRIASSIAGMPIHVTHLHSSHWSRDERGKRNILIDKVLSLRTAKIVACSNAVRNYTINEGIAPYRITTIYDSVNLEPFKVNTNVVAKRKEFGFKPSDFIVGTVARLVRVKGHEYLLQAIPKVIMKCPNAKLLIVGDGPRRSDLEKHAKQLEIDSHVVFTGTRMDVPEILAIIDLFVLPSSIREGLSLAIAEAMAAGKPAIGTRIGGIPEIIRDGVTGFILPPKDPNALAERILYFTRHPEVARKFGEAARRWCKRKHDSRIIASQFDQFYRSLSHKRS